MRRSKTWLAVTICAMVPLSAVRASGNLTQSEQRPVSTLRTTILGMKDCGLSLTPLGTIPASFAAWFRSHEPSLSVKYAQDETKFSRDLASNPAAKKQVCAYITSKSAQAISDAKRAWRALQNAHAQHK